ncbi:olfactory receptor 1500-like [Oncorhynchus clarkii lewisi]|uniref:olfactory receptor 1500-like n=1 Tax=Oncorhynchus clarkii lewisi TaxID=490388 RepID=UPI0039B958E8
MSVSATDSGQLKYLYFIILTVLYVSIVFANTVLIVVICMERILHEPMYIFLCSLCVNGLYGTAGFYPKLLLDLQSDVQVISYGGCFTQAYVIYTSVMCEISTLTVMSYDRYVAICRPLLYHTIVTSLTVRKLLLFSWLTLFDNLQGWNNVNITLNMRNAMAVQFLVIPPVFNPLIYGLNLKQIRRAVFRKCNAHKIIDMRH